MHASYTETSPSKEQHVLGARLNLGCGEDIRAGYINIDLLSNDPNVLKMDFRCLSLPDGFADEILSVHSLEHVPHTETEMVLQNWFKVLRPGGTLKLEVPDFEWCVKHWLSLPETERWGYFLASIFGWQSGPGQVHYTGFTPARVKSLLEQVGFIDVQVKTYERYDVMVIWAEAIKPVSSSPKPENGSTAKLDYIAPSFETTERIFQNKLAGATYGEYPRPTTLQEFQQIISGLQNDVEQLCKDRDYYKSRWEKLCRLPPLSWLLWFKHLLK